MKYVFKRISCSLKEQETACERVCYLSHKTSFHAYIHLLYLLLPAPIFGKGIATCYCIAHLPICLFSIHSHSVDSLCWVLLRPSFWTSRATLSFHRRVAIAISRRGNQWETTNFCLLIRQIAAFLGFWPPEVTLHQLRRRFELRRMSLQSYCGSNNCHPMQR